MARLITLMGRLSGDEDTVAALHLVYTLAMFSENLADWREAQQRLHQADAARTAARQLRAAGDRYGGEQLALAVDLGGGPTPTPAPRTAPRHRGR
jgi:hypothetical protein